MKKEKGLASLPILPDRSRPVNRVCMSHKPRNAIREMERMIYRISDEDALASQYRYRL
jgi:hypothetical protein